MDQGRRSFIGATGVGLGGLLLGASGAIEGLARQAFAAEGTGKAASGKGAANHAALVELAKTASDCVRTGEACAAHCQKELAKGNTSMAECDQRVHEMLALTRAMVSLAASDSALAAKLAPVCAEACKSCADACAEHKEHFSHGMHLQCKECMEACLACEKACRKIA